MINVQEVDPQKTAAKMSCPMPDQKWKGRLPEKKEAASGAVFNFVFLSKMSGSTYQKKASEC